MQSKQSLPLRGKNHGFSIVAVLILALVLGAVAVGGYTVFKEKGSFNLPTQLYPQKDETQAPVVSESDDPADIEKDLNAESFSDIDTDVTETQNTLNASY